MEKIHAFTITYSGVSKKLMSEAILIYNNKEYKTKNAQWDTGATSTCISKRVVKELGLLPTGKASIQTPSGSAIVNEYRIDIKLQNENVRLTNVYVMDSEIEAQGIDMLIGMNIITLGDLSVSNFNGKTVFTFRVPSVTTTDYVKLYNSKQQSKSNKIHPNAPCPCGSGQKYKRCCGRK